MRGQNETNMYKPYLGLFLSLWPSNAWKITAIFNWKSERNEVKNGKILQACICYAGSTTGIHLLAKQELLLGK